jgi:hypothetical protein
LEKNMASEDANAHTAKDLNAEQKRDKKPDAASAANRKNDRTAQRAAQELGAGAELEATPPDATEDPLPPDSKLPGESAPLKKGTDAA